MPQEDLYVYVVVMNHVRGLGDVSAIRGGATTCYSPATAGAPSRCRPTYFFFCQGLPTGRFLLLENALEIARATDTKAMSTRTEMTTISILSPFSQAERLFTSLEQLSVLCPSG